ncbi:sensor histidine kinase [Dawidia soli]|uniref:sensor histidine kinase n=1 Tax=Dawidia soli TaxID=2782352 RepID=UPI0020B328C8|nr:histidine kinase [Dawidia soli]
MVGYRPNGASSKLVFANNADTTQRLQLRPDDIVFVEAKATSDFRESDIEFSLINLETKQIEHHSENFDTADLALKAGTEYQLRFSYLLQPESVAVYYIRVNPRWYSRPITYVVLGIILVGAAFWFVTGGLKQKIRSFQKKHQKLEDAAIRLQAMLNPHFTFNALSSIQGLMNTGRVEEANHYLQEFSGLLRKTLTTNQRVFNTLDRELDMMGMYLRLEALRFNFSWHLHVAEGLDTATIEIPTLILQPLIENSIKHGISRLADKGELYILCKPGAETNSLVITIKDNGTCSTTNRDMDYL